MIAGYKALKAAMLGQDTIMDDLGAELRSHVSPDTEEYHEQGLAL